MCVSGMGRCWASAEGSQSTARVLLRGDSAGDAVTITPRTAHGACQRGRDGW